MHKLAWLLSACLLTSCGKIQNKIYETGRVGFIYEAFCGPTDVGYEITTPEGQILNAILKDDWQMYMPVENLYGIYMSDRGAHPSTDWAGNYHIGSMEFDYESDDCTGEPYVHFHVKNWEKDSRFDCQFVFARPDSEDLWVTTGQWAKNITIKSAWYGQPTPGQKDNRGLPSKKYPSCLPVVENNVYREIRKIAPYAGPMPARFSANYRGENKRRK